jgi:hypothetical protein
MLSPNGLPDFSYSDPDDEDLYTGEVPEGTTDLLGTYELAQYLGVERSRPARWLNDGGTALEKPVARLKCGPVWTLQQAQRMLTWMYEQAGMPAGEKGLGQWAMLRQRGQAGRWHKRPVS